MDRRRFLASSLALSMPTQQVRAESQQLLIDSHVHVWKRDPAFPFAPGAHPQPDNATVETLLGLMHSNHVARTVLIQVIHYKWDNSYLASVLKRYPRTFKGVCRVNPEDPAAPDQLSRLTEVQGFHGVRLSPSATPEGDWIRGPLMPPLWRRCAQLKVPMTILAPVTRMTDLIPLIEQNPDLTVVIDHMADCPLGQPEQLDLLLALARYPKVFVKISHMWSLSKQPYPYADSAEQVKHLYRTFGANRLMWGTDWPICLKDLSYAQAVSLFRDHLGFLPPEDHEQILYKTVQRVWPFNL
ncbi:metal-dependent hydrolase [Edaphobacter acidisoli]|uniref:Metal-dependent hydrolase n=1 Tax=Edaphobacter acidisoli TaxID=2040573 RepID=A0A916VYH2_9BACT|nr:amidohydrolase family protein [Edaphobacter acidisoli]GGA53421.1 metal-dependent hydrolase [Edaphobacter acidisoli]